MFQCSDKRWGPPEDQGLKKYMVSSIWGWRGFIRQRIGRPGQLDRSALFFRSCHPSNLFAILINFNHSIQEQSRGFLIWSCATSSPEKNTKYMWLTKTQSVCVWQKHKICVCLAKTQFVFCKGTNYMCLVKHKIYAFVKKNMCFAKAQNICVIIMTQNICVLHLHKTYVFCKSTK